MTKEQQNEANLHQQDLRQGAALTSDRKSKRYQVLGTATVSVWMYIHADSPAEALSKANSGEYEEAPEYDTDGEPEYSSVVEAMPR